MSENENRGILTEALKPTCNNLILVLDLLLEVKLINRDKLPKFQVHYY